MSRDPIASITRRTIERLKVSIDTRLDSALCEMKEGCDDSIVGFNTAWDIVRKIFEEELSTKKIGVDRPSF